MRSLHWIGTGRGRRRPDIKLQGVLSESDKRAGGSFKAALDDCKRLLTQIGRERGPINKDEIRLRYLKKRHELVKLRRKFGINFKD